MAAAMTRQKQLGQWAAEELSSNWEGALKKSLEALMQDCTEYFRWSCVHLRRSWGVRREPRLHEEGGGACGMW